MSRVLCCSHTRYLSPGQHVNSPSNDFSRYLLQRCFTIQISIQTTQDVSKPEAMNVDQLYQ
jgi:hypothetical protein